MTTVELVGCIAAISTTVSFLPQAIKVIKTRDTGALSLLMYSIFTFGVALWLVYGILLQDIAIICANFITLGLAVCILVVKIQNDVIKKPH